MDSPCIKQTVCKVLKIFQHGKYLVAYVLKNAQSGKHVAKVKRVHFAEDITCSREYQAKLESPHSSKEESPKPR